MISAESARKSYAVTMPTSRPFSTTGRQPILRWRMIGNASSVGVPGATVIKSLSYSPTTAAQIARPVQTREFPAANRRAILLLFHHRYGQSAMTRLSRDSFVHSRERAQRPQRASLTTLDSLSDHVFD
jgi:hypothetical protein